MENHQRDGGGDQAVGLVHPERGGQDVAGVGPGGGQGQVVVRDLRLVRITLLTCHLSSN